MKLEYKILWFEDQFKYVEQHIGRIEELVREHGFIPEIVRKTSISEAEIDELSEKLDSYNPYDLIIFDYDLGADSANGLSIATKLRALIYTDMIFYSGKVSSELRELLYQAEVDGVFVIGRPNFFDEIEPLIEDHIKRMSDINNVRGVVMSATSTIDNSVRDALIKKINGMDGEFQKAFLEKLKGNLNKNIEKQKEKVNSLECPKEAVGDHFSTTFDVIRIMFRSVFEKDSPEYLTLNDGATIHKVQVERNNLAHQKDEYTDDGIMVLHGRNGAVEYNFNSFIRLRNELLEAIDDIETHLS